MGNMSHRILSERQGLAAKVKSEGGASVAFATGKPAEGPGFMVGTLGTEHEFGGAPSDEHIQKYADEKFASGAGAQPGAHLGIWENSGRYTGDVSTKQPNPQKARIAGSREKQEAAYALPNTPVRPGVTSGEHGSDVLLQLKSVTGTPTHLSGPDKTVPLDRSRNRGYAERLLKEVDRADPRSPQFRDIAVNDSDPAYNRKAAGPDGFTDYEVDNDGWSMTNRANPRNGGSRTNLGDVLRTINRNRTTSARGETVPTLPKRVTKDEVRAAKQR
jgi:hypothetical protein